MWEVFIIIWVQFYWQVINIFVCRNKFQFLKVGINIFLTGWNFILINPTKIGLCISGFHTLHVQDCTWLYRIVHDCTAFCDIWVFKTEVKIHRHKVRNFNSDISIVLEILMIEIRSAYWGVCINAKACSLGYYFLYIY